MIAGVEDMLTNNVNAVKEYIFLLPRSQMLCAQVSLSVIAVRCLSVCRITAKAIS